MMENDFHYALFQLQQLYDIEISEEDFEEIGLIAWNLIGNKNIRLYRYSGNIDKQTLSLELPCNADIIEAVTASYEDWNYTTNKNPFGGDLNSAFVEDYIENNKKDPNSLYISGRYVNFLKVGNILYFDKNYGKINVLYKGIQLDELGLPKLNDREALAIATFVAYTMKFKEGIKTNNTNIIQMAQVLKTMWETRCDLARIPEHLNLNDMNDILDSKTSWNRKIYNKSYKPLK